MRSPVACASGFSTLPVAPPAPVLSPVGFGWNDSSRTSGAGSCDTSPTATSLPSAWRGKRLKVWRLAKLTAAAACASTCCSSCNTQAHADGRMRETKQGILVQMCSKQLPGRCPEACCRGVQGRGPSRHRCAAHAPSGRTATHHSHHNTLLCSSRLGGCSDSYQRCRQERRHPGRCPRCAARHRGPAPAMAVLER